jgi:hypothetical protein
MGVRDARPKGPLDYLIVLFSSSEKACEMKKEETKNTTLYILSISRNTFICLESILLIAVRGFISIFLCMWHDLSQVGTTGASEIFALDLCLMLICKQVHTCWRVLERAKYC